MLTLTINQPDTDEPSHLPRCSHCDRLIPTPTVNHRLSTEETSGSSATYPKCGSDEVSMVILDIESRMERNSPISE